MAYHDWSDDTFDWKGLNDAMDFIQNFTFQYSELNIMIKEKYGSIRYEFTCMWNWPKNPEKVRETMKVLRLAVKTAVELWPHLKEEITADFDLNFEDLE